VWLILGDKLGDNAQAHIIAEGLSWPFEVKQLRFREPYVVGKPPFKASLYHIDQERSATLQPPWPDLIITVGRRPCMAALWVHEQSARSVKLVLLGRPKRWLERFDLVIAPVQYRLPQRSNVLHIDLPLMRVDMESIATAAAAWSTRFAQLPRPLLALLIGGPTKPFVLNKKIAMQLLHRSAQIAGDRGGTLYVTTSRRTPKNVVETLQENLPPGAVFYHWTPHNIDNPYRALLGAADGFIVTGDSVSMLVEVVRLGKPLAIFPLPYRMGLLDRARDQFTGLLHKPLEGRFKQIFRRSGDMLYKLGVEGYSRDLTALHRLLIERNFAVWLGDQFLPPGPKAPDELPRVIKHIRTLMD
jgi:mitochondrial fission protein ELM1